MVMIGDSGTGPAFVPVVEMQDLLPAGDGASLQAEEGVILFR